MMGCLAHAAQAVMATLFVIGLWGSTGQMMAVRAEEPDLSSVVAEMVDGAILPAYDRFVATAGTEVVAIEALCETPNAETLSAARRGFAELVAGFAAIEAMRFGPAREGNRFERLFFWPDRRGRGLRQVETILLEQDEAALDAALLAQKSVAVQGVLALEFVLFNPGADGELVEPAGFRCGYARAISQRIAETAKELLLAWRQPGGFGEQMKNPNPEQPVYRSNGEALQEILRSAGEILSIDKDFKINRVIGKNLTAAKIKRAPLWRSRLWLRAISGNIAFVESLFAGPALSRVLDESQASLPDELLFELNQARRAVADANLSWAKVDEDIVLSQDEYDLLYYSTLPLNGAALIINTRLPEALGLVIGFNSLDGD